MPVVGGKATGVTGPRDGWAAVASCGDCRRPWDRDEHGQPVQTASGFTELCDRHQCSATSGGTRCGSRARLGERVCDLHLELPL